MSRCKSLPARFIPALDRVESNFIVQNGLDWVTAHWMISVYTSVAYLLLIYVGRRWMKDRAPWSLRQPLFLWNVGLACFSFFGMSVLVQSIPYNVYTYGFFHTTCHCEDCVTDSSVSLWGWLFTLSKLVEFGDTFFIVLRKSPLPFLHWYHHSTVCIYAWYAVVPVPSTLSPWFGGMNYTVHTFMYTYYAFRAKGYRVHPLLAKMVTVMQLSQMLVGIALNLAAWNMNRIVPDCDFRYDLFYLAAAMYTSYALLFANFFYQRYIKQAPPRPRGDTPKSLTKSKLQ